MNIDELAEAKVLAAVEKHGAYIGKKNCLLCLPLRRAAARLVVQGRLVFQGEVDGKQVWIKAEGEK